MRTTAIIGKTLEKMHPTKGASQREGEQMTREEAIIFRYEKGLVFVGYGRTH